MSMQTYLVILPVYAYISSDITCLSVYFVANNVSAHLALVYLLCACISYEGNINIIVTNQIISSIDNS